MKLVDDVAAFFGDFSEEAIVAGTRGNFRCLVIYDANVETFRLGNNEFDSSDKVITVKDSDGKRIERDAIITLKCGVVLKAMRPGTVSGTGICTIPVTLKTFEDQENDDQTPDVFTDTFEGLS